jgi:hypothetical protein
VDLGKIPGEGIDGRSIEEEDTIIVWSMIKGIFESNLCLSTPSKSVNGEAELLIRGRVAVVSFDLAENRVST